MTHQELNASFDSMAEVALKVKTQRDQLRRMLVATVHALRSYEHGNTSIDLAKEVADRADELLDATP